VILQSGKEVLAKVGAYSSDSNNISPVSLDRPDFRVENIEDSKGGGQIRKCDTVQLAV
jgi:hypothetical protein